MGRAVVSLKRAIKNGLGDCASLQEVDLYKVALLLQRHFPEIPLDRLALEVAKAAVEAGCRCFVWEPPEALDVVT